MPRLKRPDTAMPSSVPLLEAALVLVGFLTATLSGVAGMGGGSILIGVLLVAGLPPLEAVPLFAAVGVLQFLGGMFYGSSVETTTVQELMAAAAAKKGA